MLNTRFYVSAPGTRKPRPELRTAYSGTDAAVFEDPLAMPRAYIVGATRRASYDDTLQTLRTNRLDPRREALIPADATPHPEPGGGMRPARTQRLSDERWRVAVPGGPGGWLVLANSFSDQWEARLDGREVDLEPTNLATMGVALPSGSHTVEFRLDRGPLYLGALISAGAWLALLILALSDRRRSARE